MLYVTDSYSQLHSLFVTEFAVVDQTTPRIFAKSIHINHKLKLNTIIISAQYRITNITAINL